MLQNSISDSGNPEPLLTSAGGMHQGLVQSFILLRSSAVGHCCQQIKEQTHFWFHLPLFLSIYSNFNHPDCSCVPKSKPRHGGSCSLSTFHSNQALKDPGFCVLWLNTFLVCHGIALIAPKCPQPCLSYPALSVPPYSLSPAPTGSLSVLWRVLANLN